MSARTMRRAVRREHDREGRRLWDLLRREFPEVSERELAAILLVNREAFMAVLDDPLWSLRADRV